MPAKRTAKEVIDQLIADNRGWDWLCYLAAAAFIATGVVVVVRALFWDQSALLALVGCVCGSLFIPAFDRAQRIRKENQAIRLLEIPLSQAKTAEEAARLIHEVFREVYVHKKG